MWIFVWWFMYVCLWRVCVLYKYVVCLYVHLQCSFLDVWAPRLPLPFPFPGSVSWEALGRCVWYDCPGVLLIITMGTFSISSQWMLCRPHFPCRLRVWTSCAMKTETELGSLDWLVHHSHMQLLQVKSRPGFCLGRKPGWGRRAAKEGSARPTWLPFPPPQLSDKEAWK